MNNGSFFCNCSDCVDGRERRNNYSEFVNIVKNISQDVVKSFEFDPMKSAYALQAMRSSRVSHAKESSRHLIRPVEFARC